MKQELFEYLNQEIGPARQRYQELLAAPQHIESVLQEGARKARAKAAPFLAEIRRAVGIRPLYE